MDIKQRLKKQTSQMAGKSNLVKSIYHRLALDKYFKRRRYNYYKNLDPKDYPAELKKWYLLATGTPLNLENPQTFNEKIQWMKLYDSTPLKTRLADKYLVRDWVAEKIGSEYLIPLLGVWDSFDEIDFESLPNQFVLKANHGSGWNVIVRDKNTFDKADAKRKFDSWMKTNFAYSAGLELHYRDIIPKIIAEKYIADEHGDLNDYKFLCFNGTTKYVWVDTDRYLEHKRDIYDLNWNHQPFTIAYPNSKNIISKPDNLMNMVELSNTLSKEFSHVRVDFYNVDGIIYFGEMTFTSGNGAECFIPEEYNLRLGGMIEI